MKFGHLLLIAAIFGVCYLIDPHHAVRDFFGAVARQCAHEFLHSIGFHTRF